MVLCVILLAVAFGTPARAGVRVGLEIGANVSSLSYAHLDAFPQATTDWDPGWRTSFTGGASLELPFRSRFSVMTGLRYVQQGNRVKVNIPGSPPLKGEFRIAQNYVAVPVLLAFRPTSSQRYFVAAGPEGALLFNGKTFSDYGLGSSTESITSGLQRANLSLDAETGLEFPAGRRTGAVIVRYTHGLFDAQKKDDWLVTWKTRGVEGLVGMRW